MRSLSFASGFFLSRMSSWLAPVQKVLALPFNGWIISHHIEWQLFRHSSDGIGSLSTFWPLWIARLWISAYRLLWFAQLWISAYRLLWIARLWISANRLLWIPWPWISHTGSCEPHGCGYLHTGFRVDIRFLSPECISITASSYGSSMFNCRMSFQNVFWSSCTVLHFCQ